MISKEQLKTFLETITKNEIHIVKQIKFGKWYEQEFTRDFEFIETQSHYGICINGTTVDYIMSTGKTEDSIYKSAISQFISKYQIKTFVEIDGEIRCKTREECLKELKNENRVTKYLFYTTLYGIGFFSFFMNYETEIDTINLIGKYLKDRGVKFKPSKSEAGWVTRLVINKDVEFHNQLLKEFDI